MKIVINAYHGSFGLSRKAVETLRERGVAWAQHSSIVLAGEPYEDGYLSTYESDSYSPSDRCDPAFRADLELVCIVEELGSDADGCCAELEIVEIPDDVEWRIEKYDGREWIAEKHRTWP